MILHGENLMISVDGSVLAASKSCTVDVDADTIKVSSPTDGQWEHSIPGRKSWKVTTNHLLLNIMNKYPMVSVFSRGWYVGGSSSIDFQGITKTFYTRGIHVVRFYESSGNWYATSSSYDTLNDDGDITSFITDCTNGFAANDSDIIAICTVDAFVLNAEMRTAISTYLHVPAEQIPLCSLHGAISLIGSTASSASGICFAGIGQNISVHADAYYISNMIRTLDTPIKTMLQKVGQTFTLQLMLDGYGSDTLHGSAICKSAKITATKSNLLQGSFVWEGSGPLT